MIPTPRLLFLFSLLLSPSATLAQTGGIQFDFARPWLVQPGTMPDDLFDQPDGHAQAIIIPTWASLDPATGTYSALVQGVLIQRPVTPSTYQRTILNAYKKVWPTENAMESARLDSRFSYFFANTLGATSSVQGLTVAGVPAPSMQVGEDGWFQTTSQSLVQLPSGSVRPGTIATVEFTGLANIAAPQFGRVHVYGQFGWTIITDIDDTVKDTGVIVYSKMFHEAFIETYAPIPGMPELFQAWQRQLATPETPDVAFHYMSGTPYSLLPAEDRFFSNWSFPQGPIQLAKLRLKNPMTVVQLPEVAQFKIDETHRIVQSFPSRQYILVGDSGQLDGKAYGSLMREDPNGTRYQCAFIRLVTGVDAKKEAGLNQPARFQEYFQGVDPQRWYLFLDPSELMQIDWQAGRCRPSNVPDTVMGGGLQWTEQSLSLFGRLKAMTAL